MEFGGLGLPGIFSMVGIGTERLPGCHQELSGQDFGV